MLEVLHPRLPDCDLCQKYQWNPEEGQFERAENGAFRKRLPEIKPPCRTKKGCPKGTPEAPRTLWKNNRKAYEFYLECEAVGNFPDDPYVRRIARLIREVLNEAQEAKRKESSELSLFKVLLTNAARNRPNGA